MAFPEDNATIPMSEYAKRLEVAVRKRYLDKISVIGIDPVLIDGKRFEPDCLPPVQSTDLLCFLVLETSYYTNKQFRNFRSLEAYNQMVSGWIESVQGHVISDKFVVLAKVRHSQRMNDNLISIWIITEKEGPILSAHCMGCKAGLAESCSHIACILFYLEWWNKVNGEMACTQMKCTWIQPPSFVKNIEYARVRDINFTSARKLKKELDSTDNLPDVFEGNQGQLKNEVPAPTKEEIQAFNKELSDTGTMPVVLSLITPYAEAYVLPSRDAPTVMDLHQTKYLDLSYPDLINLCKETKIKISSEEIAQIERDTINQAKGKAFFKHRAGRIGASQSKAASHSDPSLPSQSLIQNICYPELNKFTNKAVEHGCKHEETAIREYELRMKQTHTNFKVERCGLIINEDYPWLHATPDFLCSCDCCGKGCGEVKCPLCLENSDFETYSAKKSSCLKKDSCGNYLLPKDHQYYYQVQQQVFTAKRLYCDFIVCAVSNNKGAEIVQQRILPDPQHWETVLPKLEQFWRIGVLPEVLGRWYTRKHTVIEVPQSSSNGICYCRKVASDNTVKCSNPKCPIGLFHLDCLGIESTTKVWYCPNCRSLPEFRRSTKSTNYPATTEALKLSSICICKEKPSDKDRLLKCHSVDCKNGKFFHLACLGFKRMPNNSNTWICPVCKGSTKTTARKGNKTHLLKPGLHTPQAQPGTNSPQAQPGMQTPQAQPRRRTSQAKPPKTSWTRPTVSDKYSPEGRLGQYELNLVASGGWLDCVVIHQAHLLLRAINMNIKGFQRPTLGILRQFDIMTGDFVQILHVRGNHWVCMTSIGCPPGDVIVLDSLTSPVTQELQELAISLVGPNFRRITKPSVQTQTNGSDCGVFSIAFCHVPGLWA